MKTFLIIGSICLAIYFFDKICLWLEKQGWLYYRNKKAESGIIGNALLELHSLLNPGTRHVIEVKQNAVKQKRNEADVPGELKK
jgi:hypothetical protein